MSKKLDSPKKKCEHKDTSPSSDPLIWYICHDCGAHLNQRFEVIPASYHATVNEVLKTEKIDSETLKRIKNLAQEESDFYDKHGYYSFWSDKLKAQRIKDSEGYKDAKFDLYSSDKDYEIGKVLKQTEKKELTLDELLAKCDKCPTVFTQRSDGMFGCDLRCKDVDNKEEKKEDYFDRQIRLGNIPKYQEDSGGEESEGYAGFDQSHKIESKTTSDSKLPDLICPFCGRKLIRYKQAWICGHGCTKPALKPIGEKLPKLVCTLKEQNDCDEEGSMDCLEGNPIGERFGTAVCVHGKRELEKLPEPTGVVVMSKALDDLDEIYCIHCGKQKEKLPEPIKACFNCYYLVDWSECPNRHAYSYKEFIFTTFKTGICNNYRPIEKTDPKCPQCGTLLHECGTNPEKILFLCNKCGHKIKQETEPEKNYRLTIDQLKHLDKYKFIKEKGKRGYWTPKEKLPEPDCSECKFSFGHDSYCSHKGLCLHGDKFEPKEKLGGKSRLA